MPHLPTPPSAASIEVAYARYFPLIRDKCRRMLGDHALAQDVAQDTFLRLWREAAPLDEAQRLAWIYKTATRLAIDKLRERARRPSEAHAEPVAAASGADELLAARAWLQRVVRQFPERELSVLIMTRIDRMTQPEIAQALGLSERTVRRSLETAERRAAKLRGAEP